MVITVVTVSRIPVLAPSSLPPLCLSVKLPRSFHAPSHQIPAASLFSFTYKLPIFYPLCFDIHTCNGGCTPLPFTLFTLLSLFGPRVFYISSAINRFRTLSQNCRGVYPHAPKKREPHERSGPSTRLLRYNERMAVRLIALDIDGTLLDSRWHLPEANRSAIAEAARRGIEVALVTGRRYDFAMPVARQLDSPLTMIVNNGALIRSKEGRTHLCHLLPRDTAQRVLELTRPWREGAAVVFDRARDNQLMLEVLDPDDSMRYAYYSRNKEFIGLANPLESCLTEDPIQVMLSGKVAPMREAEQALRNALFADEFGLAVTAYESKDFAMIDVINPACSKGSSLAEWAALRSLAREEVMAIGDNHNDLEMLSFAGIPVVMGNGVPELKTFGWHETGTNDENGVATAIELFALQEAAPCA